MKKGILITTAIMFTIITMFGNAFAWDGCGKKGMGKGFQPFGHGCKQQMELAKLTDEQKAKLKVIHQKFIDETATARAGIISKYAEIKILMETTSPDKAKLHTIISEVTELQKQVMDKKIDMALDAKKVAPELDIPMGFHQFGKRAMMGMGNMEMMDGCGMGMMGNTEMMNGCGMGMMGDYGMMGKGMSKGK